MSEYDAKAPLSMPPQRHRVRRAVDDGVSEAEAWARAKDRRGKPAIAPPPSVARATAKAIRPMAARFGPGLGELEGHWEEIVGEALATYSRPERFQSGAKGLTLLVRARGPAAALVEAQAPQIIERVARYAGKRPKALKIVQGPLSPATKRAKPRPALITPVKSITPEPKGLDAVLSAFEAAVKARESVSLPAAPSPITKE